MTRRRISKHPFAGFRPATSETKFDLESGQIFTETEVRFNRKQRSDWICEYQTPVLFKSRQPPNEHGARSLFDMAKNRVAREFRSLDADHFAHIVPWEVAEQLWEEVSAIRAESFHAWRTLAKSYGHDFSDAKYRYKLDIKDPALPLPNYFKGLASPTTSWLTCLRISPKPVASTTDLVAIAQISNIAVLDLSDSPHSSISHNPSPLSERIFRSWTELAASEGAFGNLRTLLLGWQDNVSAWLFKYLAAFPALTHVILTDCPHLHQRNREAWEAEALMYGWLARRQKRSAKSLRPILDDKSFYVGAVSGFCYQTPKRPEPEKGEERPAVTGRLGDPESKEGESSSLPVMECWIGNPRPWTHILDEFPGTRTVWFDRVDPPQRKAESEHGMAKRGREGEVVAVGTGTAKEEEAVLRSPPSKRTQQGHGERRGRAGLKPTLRAPGKTAEGLLAEFTR